VGHSSGLGYVKIPNFYEIDEMPRCSSVFVVEEKIDGKTFEGSSSCTVFRDYEICIFGECMGITHLIFYRNLPNDIVVFDVRVDGRYLKPQYKLLLSIIIGLPHVPVKGVIDRIDEKIIEKYYLHEKSFFKTDLNPEICRRHPEPCEEFRNIYGEDFSEGVVVKCYEDGEIRSVKYVKPEFDRIIDTVGRYEEYPNRNIVNFDLDFAVELQRNNMEKIFGENIQQELLLELFREAYPATYMKKTAEEIIRSLPDKNRRLLELTIEKCINNPKAC